MTTPTLSRGRFLRFKKPCKSCSSLFRPIGKYCYYCDDCLAKSRSNARNHLLRKSAVYFSLNPKTACRGFPRVCTRCNARFIPTGKKQRLCVKCFDKSMNKRNNKMKQIWRAKKRLRKTTNK